MGENELEPLVLLTRESWGALPAKKPAPLLEPPLPMVIIHWGTDTDPCETTEECSKTVQSIQKTHMEEKGLDDIAYNFLIGGDGKAYTGRGWEGAPAPLLYEHHGATKRIDIAYIGRDWGRANIPWEMLKSALQLLSAGVDSKLLDAEYETTENPEEILEGDEEQ